MVNINLDAKNKIEFRAADLQSDYEFAKLVHHTVYKDVVVRQFGIWDESQQDLFFKEGWENGPQNLILLKDLPIGILSVSDFPDHIFINEVQILPEYQGQGIGRGIIEEQIELAKAKSLPIKLRVLRENRAKELYLRLGFVIVEHTDIGFIMALK